MTVSKLAFALVVFAACGDSSSDPCSGAPSGTACLWAGTGARGFNAADPTAHRLDSQLNQPSDLTFAPDGRAYIIDWNNHMIRRLEKTDSLTVVMGTAYEGDGPPEMEDRLPLCAPTGALGTTVALNHPTDAKFGPDGLLYVAAWHNNKIRVLDPETDMVVSLAGNGYGYAGDNGPACNALFNQPKTLLFGPDGTMYTIDQRNVRIRAISPWSGTGMPNGATQTITEFAGDGVLGNGGDGGLAVDADFGFATIDTPPLSGALALVGKYMYVADSLNNRIRRIDMTTGIIDCIAGQSAQPGYSGDGGPAISAKFNFPVDLEVGPDGRLYVADSQNNVIRAIDLTTGIVDTVVGNGTLCDNTMQTCPDRGPATAMGLYWPHGIAFDAAGTMYVADTYNSRILKVVR